MNMGQAISRLFSSFFTPNTRVSDVYNPNDENNSLQIPYFGLHFLMGGELYDRPKSEVFLFGEKQDLELLGKSKRFPYNIRGISDTVGVLKALLNVRKDTVNFVKIDVDSYRIEFILDCDSSCFVQIHFHSREIVEDGALRIIPRYSHEPSEKIFFEAGAGHVFNNFIYNPKNDSRSMRYDGGNYFPLVIELSTHNEWSNQSQVTLCSIDISNDASATPILKPLKQKLIINGAVYLQQEIFGIENKVTTSLTDGTIPEPSWNESEENSADCIICMSNYRDTLILPCRHLCVCSQCAEALRYKLNNCPICRIPFKALLRFRTLVTKTEKHGISSTGLSAIGRYENSGALENVGSIRIRVRQETLTLLEAINGFRPSISQNSTPAPSKRASVVVHCSDKQQGLGVSSYMILPQYESSLRLENNQNEFHRGSIKHFLRHHRNRNSDIQPSISHYDSKQKLCALAVAADDQLELKDIRSKEETAYTKKPYKRSSSLELKSNTNPSISITNSLRRRQPV